MKKPKKRIYNCPIPVIGLTGGIATGKSLASSFFMEKGLPVIDADNIVKKIYAQENSFLFIKNNFPEAIDEGKISFPKLREIFFHNQEAQTLIENFIYPQMPDLFLKELEHYSQNIPFVIYDIPLLFEKKLSSFFDTIVLIYASKEQQIERLIKRDHLSEEMATQILKKQLPIDHKKNLTENVIYNTKDHSYFYEQLDHFVSSIRNN